ncbi:von Willebrand factor type A domain-containing protein [Desulfofundulus australicus DSM 11792]|uniref:von Willebrand factor type A domain-containing protein n=1 Tax=Desulfofundulus australicus DSM 11792 TaxID=1121425 RepID=A0A1M4XR52_9FIRM|nr:VWA domain-containing protein [Desulfofundulus australicus]SHE95722.1 von Willebrand factor type A domain-containing protein [Desulfofundulus australicus DSM 11792]
MSLQELKRVRLQSLARVLSNKGDLTLMFGAGAYTDLKNITLVPFEGQIEPGVPASEKECWLALKASCAHEAGHIRFTDKNIWQEARRRGGNLLAHILNIIEDARVERCMANIYPGAMLWFRFMNDYIFVNRKDWGTGPRALLGALVCYAVVGRVPDSIASQEDVMELVRKCAPHIDAGRLAKDTRGALECAAEILDIVKDYFSSYTLPEEVFTAGTESPEEAPEGELDPRREPKLPEISRKEFHSHCGEEKKDEGGAREDRDEKESFDTDGSGDKTGHGERLDEPGSGEGERSVSLVPPGEEDSSKEDSPEGDFLEEDFSEEDSPEEDSFEEDSFMDGSPGSDSSKNDSSREPPEEEYGGGKYPEEDLPEEEPEKFPGDESPSEGESPGSEDLVTIEEDDGDSSEEEFPDDEGFPELEELEDSLDDLPEGKFPDEGFLEEEFEGDLPEEGSPEGNGDESPDEEWGSETPLELPGGGEPSGDDIDMDDYLELLESAGEELETIETAASRVAKLEIPAADISEEEIVKELSRDIHKGVEFILKKIDPDRYARSQYEKLYSEVKGYISRTVDEIRRVLEYRAAVRERNLRKGKLDCGALWKLRTGDPKIFYKVNEPGDIPRLAVYLLVDCSGSMTGPSIHAAKSAACLLYEVCEKLKIPVNVTGFTGEVSSWSDVTHYRAVGFGEADRKHAIARLDAFSQNRDGYSIRVAARELLLRNEEQKVLIVLSDGVPFMPYRGYGGETGVRDTALAVRETEKMGIGVIGLYFGPENYLVQAQKIYNNLVYVRDIGVLPRALGRVLKKVIAGL